MCDSNHSLVGFCLRVFHRIRTSIMRTSASMFMEPAERIILAACRRRCVRQRRVMPPPHVREPTDNLIAIQKQPTIRRMDVRQKPPIKRRCFLQQGVAAAAMTACNQALASSASQAAITQFGYSLYGMKTLPLERALAAATEIGYDAIELAAMDGWPADPAKLSTDSRQQLSRQLADLKLSLVALMVNLSLDVDDAQHRQNVDSLRAVADLAHELAADRPPLIETVLGGKAGTWEKLRERFAARLTDWERVAAKSETVIAVKPHRFGAMNAPQHALWLLERVNSRWIRLVYDFSHFQHREFTLAETLRQLAPLAAMIHIKDTVIEHGQPRFVLPGDGGVDYVDLLKQAVGSGFSGPICVEVSGMVQNQPSYDAVAAAKHAYRSVAPAFAKAGVSRPVRQH